MGTRRGSEQRRMASGVMVRMDDELAARVRSAADAAGLSVPEWFRRRVADAVGFSHGAARRGSSRRSGSVARSEQIRLLVAAADRLAEVCDLGCVGRAGLSDDAPLCAGHCCHPIITAARFASDALVTAIEAAGSS